MPLNDSGVARDSFKKTAARFVGATENSTQGAELTAIRPELGDEKSGQVRRPR